MVGFKLKSRVTRYKNNCYHIILNLGLEYIYLILSTLTDDEFVFLTFQQFFHDFDHFSQVTFTFPFSMVH